jgi:uncharacterized protein
VPGETNLRKLLAAMMPVLRPEEYVYWTLPPGESLPAGTVPFATVREDEGLTVVIEHQPGWEPAGDDAYRAITIGVHSSLRAVGFTAVVARKLADNDIPANVIAGYYHDHVLVPAASANRAMMLLRELSYLG